MTQPLSHHLLTMAYQNAWANHRLAKAWMQLDGADLAAPRISFFPSIRLTLNHILTCDWFYVDALERELRGAEPHPDCYVFFIQDEPVYRGCVPARGTGACGSSADRLLRADARCRSGPNRHHRPRYAAT